MPTTRSSYKKDSPYLTRSQLMKKNLPYLTKNVAFSEPLTYIKLEPVRITSTKSKHNHTTAISTKSKPVTTTSSKSKSVIATTSTKAQDLTESLDIIPVAVTKPTPYSGISDEDDERAAVAILVATFTILMGFLLYTIANLFKMHGEKALYSPQIYFTTLGLFITIRSLRSIKDIM